MVFQYIFTELSKRLTDFFRRWYGLASIRIWANLIERLSSIDRVFAIRINAKLWSQPLYGDYTIVGRIIGPIFRIGRIIIGLSMYVVLTLVTFVAWLVWLMIPLYIISRIITG